MKAGLVRGVRRVAATAGLGILRDTFLDLEVVSRFTLRRDGRTTTAADVRDRPLPPFAGDPSRWLQPGDRTAHPGDATFGWDTLGRRAAARALLTEVSSPAFRDGASEIACHATAPAWAVSAPPQVMFDAGNLVIDFDGLYPALTNRHRPRHKTGHRRQYHRYRAGALSGACRWSQAFQLEAVPRDLLRDIFGSFRPWTGDPAIAYDEIVDHPVLFVTREGDQSRNAFHAMADFVSAFEMILVANETAPGVARQNLEVVLLDNAVPGWLDPLWRRLFAPVRGMRRVGDFGGRRVLFRRALFSAPGYQSFLFAYLNRDDVPLERVGMLDAFSALVLRSSGFSPEAPRAAGPLRVTFVSRRPYRTREIIGRQIANEAACVDALTALGDVRVRVADFAQVPLDAQLAIARDTDFLVGAHGAALTHLLWTPPHAGLLEIAARDGIDWKVFPHLAQWTGRPHVLIDAPERAVDSGSELTIDVDRFAAAARDVVGQVRQRGSIY